MTASETCLRHWVNEHVVSGQTLGTVIHTIFLAIAAIVSVCA
jgi:hypothetical protein